MYSGFLDFLSQLVSPQLSSKKLPGKLMLLLINLCGNFHLKNQILPLLTQQKKVHILVDCSLKVQDGMVTETV